MKNKELWEPTKFELTKKGLRATRNPKYMGKGASIFLGDIIGDVYEKLIREYAYGILLDLGCGKVPLYEVYKNLISDSICIDWTPTKHQNVFLDFECDLNLGIPLPNESVDTILITDVVEHISNPDLLWMEMVRVLKQSGRIIMGTPFLHNLHDEPYDYFRYTEFAIKYFCEKNNLSILILEPYGGTPEVIMNIIAKHLSFSKIIAFSHLFVAKTIVNIPLSKYISRRTARKFPLGYGVVAEKMHS